MLRVGPGSAPCRVFACAGTGALGTPTGDRVTFTTGAIRIEPDRRHVTLPRIGTVRVQENTRRLERLIAKGRARILAATVSRRGTRLVVAFRVLIQRTIQPRVSDPSRGSEWT